MEYFILAVVALPLASALLTHLLSGSMDRRVSVISISGLLATFLSAVVLLWYVITNPGSIHISLGIGWGSLLVDPLSALMSVVVSGISLIVHIYSRRYMAEEAGYGRYFVLLDLMTASLLIMVAAGDLITLLIAWHLIGILLYLLLGQDTRSDSAFRYGSWTLITYRFGDLPLVLAAVLLFNAYGTWSLPDIFNAMMANPEGETFMGMPLPQVVAGLVALSAFARSAQFFMHTWLPYTMSGPTPVSALMHAGIVNAGGFLINRFAPVFINSGEVLHIVFIVGLVTAVIGSVLMLTQHDVKKALGYSTMGQMGFMVMECGVGAFSLAVFHLIAHGVFKGTLFLSAGGVINEARKSDGVPKDDLYTFVVDRKPAHQNRSWLLMAALTIAVPGIILFLAHYVVEQEFLEKQGAIVLLFFGWITGAQLIFATHRMRTENVARLFTLILVSFTVIVMGYTLIAHAFDLFLYPDPEFRKAIYAAAGVDLVLFDIIVATVTGVIVLGWLFKYYSEQPHIRDSQWFHGLRHRFYRTISRELYIMDIYNKIARMIIASANRLNVLLRWG